MLFREINDKYSTDKIRLGYSSTYVLGDELDSASVFLTNIDNIEINPYDMIELTDLKGNKSYYLVASYVKEFATFNEPYKYNYQVNLMSLTKKLETILLPNLAITNIGQNRVVRYYIKKYANFYFKELNDFEIPEKLENMTCPEFTFNQSTLREVLDALYSLAGCLVKLDYRDNKYILTYQDLNERKSEMNRKYIATMASSATADNYVSSLESDLDNFISKDSLIEEQILKTEEYAFDSRNAKILLTHKIYDILNAKIKKVLVDLRVHAKGYKDGYGVGTLTEFKDVNYIENLGTASDGVEIKDIDITDHIVNERVFNSLKTLKSGKYNPITMHNTLYKNNTLFFKRGDNKIDNFTFYQTGNLDWLLSQDDTAFNQLIRHYVNENKTAIFDSLKFNGIFKGQKAYWIFEPVIDAYNPSLDSVVKVIDSWKNAVLEIEYIPFTSAKINYEKNKSVHNVEMFNNQSDSLVDIESFSKQSYEKVRQLGNDALEFSARNPGNDIIYELGMTFDDYILAKLEITRFLNQTYYKGLLYKNFSNRNIQTILNRQKRYTSLQDMSESVVRHENTKTYLKVDFDYSVYPTMEYFQLPKYATFTSDLGLAYEEATGALIPTFVKSGNSITYTIEFYDNNAYGIKRSEDIEKTQIESIEYLKYVNDLGELYDIKISFYDNHIESQDFVKDFPLLTDNTKGNTLLFATKNINILKDAREHLKISHEIIFKSDTLIIGNAFASVIGNSDLKVKKVDFKVDEYTDTSIYKNNYDFTYTLNGGTRFNAEVGKNYILFNDNGLVLGINNFNDNNKFIVLKYE